MATKVFLMVLGCALSMAACQSAGTDLTPKKTATATAAPEPKISEAHPPAFSTNSAPDSSAAVNFPFADFPKVSTTAKPGDYVLAPSFNWIKDAADKGIESTSFVWYVQKMALPEKENSELQFLQERHRVPNPYIIAIPQKQSVKKGDIVLTWWQTGSGMQRAIVVDDANPAQPIVRYLDIAYDNPAKSRDGVTTIGKMDERIVPNSFVKLQAWDAGTVLAVQDGANEKYAKLIRLAGNQVLVMDGGSKLKVYAKNSCRAVPLTPNVNAGDRVKAPRYGQNFAGATVSSVDPRNGRVFVRFDGDKDDKAIAFGEVLKD